MLSVSNKTTANIGTLNPFRYRSYYYDTETGLYYLQTRYYDPEIGRFINADGLDYLGEGEELSNYNLFAYCGNNPVNNEDPEGTLPNWAKIAIGAAAIAIGVIATVVSGGAAAPALIAGIKTAVIAGVVSAATSAATSAVKSVVNGDSLEDTLKNAGKAAIDGFCDGFMWGGIGFGASRSIGCVTKTTGVFKRQFEYKKNNFMFGDSELTVWKHGGKFRIDISATKGFHYHIKTPLHGISYHRTKYVKEFYASVIGIKNIIAQAIKED